MRKRFLLPLLLCLLSLALGAEPSVWILPENGNGLYKSGDTITWTLKADVTGDCKWQVQYMGVKAIAEGTVSLGDGATVTCPAGEPGWYLLTVSIPYGGPKPFAAMGGALVDETRIKGTTPEPADFDAFWKAQLALLAAIPMDPKIESTAQDGPVEYGKISIANIGGTRIRGWYAKPTGEGPFPAVAMYQYAGVYPINQGGAVGMAKRGYLALNILAHDLPVDEPAAFYKQQGDGALKDYVKMGFTNRDTTYFRRMLLGTRRALDWLMAQKEWNRKTLVVTGTSQGGIQSFAAAGLCKEVTHLAVNVPAGCDLAAASFGRRLGWPYWGNAGDLQNLVDITAGYYDPTKFAARTKAKSLVAVGLIDTTSPPSHVLSTFNALAGEKELISMPASPHTGKRGEQKGWQDGSVAFFAEAAK